jgi:hypothetical protein
MAEAVVGLMNSADDRKGLSELARLRVDDLYGLERFEESVARLVRSSLNGSWVAGGEGVKGCP